MRRSWWGPIGFVVLNLLLFAGWVAVQLMDRSPGTANAKSPGAAKPETPAAVSTPPAERAAPPVSLAKTLPLDTNRPRHGG